MTKDKLNSVVKEAKAETLDALQTMSDAMNHGQQKQIVKDFMVRELFDRYGVSLINIMKIRRCVFID